MEKSFALIGAAGFVAPRHMKAIKDTGNTLVAALDTNDSVGIIDSYFPEAKFFTQFEIFDRHVSKLSLNKTEKIDYFSICSPNYLHDSHIRYALRSGASAICEKPLVLEPHNLQQLKTFEQTSGKKISTILQLRLHPSVLKLRQDVKTSDIESSEIELTYITSRGNWYHQSWKGDKLKSGGLEANIGIHFFDMLCFVFGKPKKFGMTARGKDFCAGYLYCGDKLIKWFLSISANHLPTDVASKGQRTYRSLKIGGEEFEFSDGFADLHTESYKNILAGNGFGLDEAQSSIEITSELRKLDIDLRPMYAHPYVTKI